MPSKSQILVALKMTEKEFDVATKFTNVALREALRKVVFNGYTYPQTGFSKQAIYSGMKRLYKKKYGVDFKAPSKRRKV